MKFLSCTQKCFLLGLLFMLVKEKIANQRYDFLGFHTFHKKVHDLLEIIYRSLVLH